MNGYDLGSAAAREILALIVGAMICGAAMMAVVAWVGMSILSIAS